MMEYPKTENLWVRDPETHLMAPGHGFRLSSFSQVNKWLVTEKIDGMNMRVIWSPNADKEPRIYGRTDRAQIPGDLLAYMQGKFTYETMMAAFSYFVSDESGENTLHCRPESVILFGEGYGPGIQKGGHYRDDKSFALFDVVVDDHWLSWENVEDVARKLSIETVPVIGTYPTALVQQIVNDLSIFGAHGPLTPPGRDTEGIVARTDPYLFDNQGRRVMFKHKVRDVAALRDLPKLVAVA